MQDVCGVCELELIPRKQHISVYKHQSPWLTYAYGIRSYQRLPFLHIEILGIRLCVHLLCVAVLSFKSKIEFENHNLRMSICVPKMYLEILYVHVASYIAQ